MNTSSFDYSKPSTSFQQNQDEEIDLRDLFVTLMANKWLIFGITIIILAIGIAKALIDSPVYKVNAILQIHEQSKSLDALEPVAALLESKVPILGEIEIIKSRKVLGEVVKNLNLEIIAKPKRFPVIGTAIARRFESKNENEVSDFLFGFDQYAWGGEIIRVDTFNVPSSLLDKQLTLQAGEHGKFSLIDDANIIFHGEVGKLSTGVIGDTNQEISIFVSQLKARPNTLFTLTRKSTSDTIASLYEDCIVAEKGKGTGILELTMESTDSDMASSILNEIANIYVRINVEQKSAEAQKTLEFLDKQLPLLKDQLEAATTSLNDYRTRKGSVDLDLETQRVLKGVVEIRTQITLLQQKRDELRQKFTESHPSVVAVDKQIARLQAQMGAQDKEIENLPETQQVILRLSRDVKVNTELYTTLLNNSQTLRVAKAGTVGDVRIIDEAVVPSKPIKPKKALIIGVSFILGIVLGVITAFVRKSLHRGIQDPDLIEKNLNIPVYATVPHSNSQKSLSDKIKRSFQLNQEPTILALENPDDLSIESLRSLRTTLHFAFLEAQNNIIMITGPSPGVGKSFVSVNLAVVLADAGKKILLIDADLRKGFINKFMGQEREQGLSDLISETITAKQAVRAVSNAKIDFIPTGSIPPNPSELLMHERFAHLLESLSKEYDHIIIDSPPVLAVTDASIIGRLASVTLMVVKAGEHPLRELEQSVKRLTQSGVHLKGFVFNDVPETVSRYGYSYGKYIYQYSYQKEK